MGFGDSWRGARDKRKQQDELGMSAWDRGKAGWHEAREKNRAKDAVRAEKREARNASAADMPSLRETARLSVAAVKQDSEDRKRAKIEEASVVVGSPEQALAKFRRVVDDRIADGWSLDSRTDTIAVMTRGSRPNHLLHLVLTIVTFGLWLVVWINVASWGGKRRSTIRVHENGSVVEVMQMPGPFKSWPPRKRTL